MSQSSPVNMPFPSQPSVKVPSMAWRLGWKLMDSCRLNFALTGRLNFHAASAAMCWALTSSLPPKPPPTSMFSTTTRSGSQPNMMAVSLRVS